jgi:hypothetical protein
MSLIEIVHIAPIWGNRFFAGSLFEELGDERFFSSPNRTKREDVEAFLFNTDAEPDCFNSSGLADDFREIF